MSNEVLSRKEKEFIDIVRSRMTEDDTKDDLEAVVFPAVLSLDGENDNPIFDSVYRYVCEKKDASLSQILEYTLSLMPPVEITDENEESA